MGYTADDLLAAATAAGHPDLTPRALTDWVQRGLLDRPARQSKGRGQGSAKATYSQAQRDLLRLLLDKRGDSHRVTHLLAIPIAIWLYWGEEYVPTRQARRALSTWAKSFGTLPAARAVDGVDALVEQVAHPDANETALKGLRRTLMGAATSSNASFPADLEGRISDVVDPHGEGRTVGLPGLRLDPRALINSWLMQRRAIHKVTAGDVRPIDLERARSELQRSMAEYTLLQPVLAALDSDDPYAAVEASPIELEMLVKRAPVDLLLALAAVMKLGPA